MCVLLLCITVVTVIYVYVYVFLSVLSVCVCVYADICPLLFTDTSSASEDEGSLRRQAAVSAALAQSLQSPDYWINRSLQGSSTSSSASSTLSHGEPKSQNQSQNTGPPVPSALADVLAHTRLGGCPRRPPVGLHSLTLPTVHACSHGPGVWSRGGYISLKNYKSNAHIC